MVKVKRSEDIIKNSVSSFLVVVFCFYFLLFSFHTVFAQQFGISITPPHLEVIIKPGKSILIAYKIQNFGDPMIMKSNIYSFIPRGNQGDLEIKNSIEGPIRFELDNSDIAFDQPFFLNSKEDQQLLLRIRIPEGSPEGDYYYNFVTENVPSPAGQGFSYSQAKGRVGSNILITVTNSGRIDLKGKISIFDVLARYKFNLFGKSYKLFDSGDVIPVILIAENKGKNLIKPNGDIILRGNFGEKALYNVIPNSILAESQRQLSATPSALINCDQGRRPFYCNKDSTLLISGFFLGKYDLSTTLSFGEGAPNIYSTVAFIALPIKFFIGISTIIIISLILIKSQKNKKQE